jgi:D-lactate dehydrogenase (cytochrome)
MPNVTVHARAPGSARMPEIVEDPAIVAAYLEDASGGGPGAAAGLVRPRNEAEACAFLRATAGRGVAVLPQAARSSLTGGGAPRGEIVLSVERWTDLAVGRSHVRAGAGVRLRDLQQALAARGLFFPPVPTYQDAMLGGAIATDAGGAATFKYGKTRAWVRGLRVLLFNGDVLEIERGEAVAAAGSSFRIALSTGQVLEVPVPVHRLPALKKISAGYHASDPLDLVDLFVGSEGTLGVIAAATLDVVAAPGALLAGAVFVPGEAAALALAAALCAGARARAGPDVRSVEMVDRRGLALVSGGLIPREPAAMLTFEVELPASMTAERTQTALAAALNGGGGSEDAPVVRLARILDEHGALENAVIALPGDERARAAIAAARESVPMRVNEILAERRRADAGISKCGGDLIVPVAALPEAFSSWERAYAERGLEWAIWGHVSDGNMHPNAIPRSSAEAEAARTALLAFGDDAVRRGGAPLAEHGVGRSALKQEMLRRFLGDAAIAGMRAVKRALDPEGRFAPGVLFASDAARSS